MNERVKKLTEEIRKLSSEEQAELMDDVALKTFGDRLREARQKANYASAQEFARALRMEPHAYRKYERGESNPKLGPLTRMCFLLGVTPNDLMPHAARVDGVPFPSGDRLPT